MKIFSQAAEINPSANRKGNMYPMNSMTEDHQARDPVTTMKIAGTITRMPQAIIEVGIRIEDEVVAGTAVEVETHHMQGEEVEAAIVAVEALVGSTEGEEEVATSPWMMWGPIQGMDKEADIRTTSRITTMDLVLTDMQTLSQHWGQEEVMGLMEVMAMGLGARTVV